MALVDAHHSCRKAKEHKSDPIHRWSSKVFHDHWARSGSVGNPMFSKMHIQANKPGNFRDPSSELPGDTLPRMFATVWLREARNILLHPSFSSRVLALRLDHAEASHRRVVGG